MQQIAVITGLQPHCNHACVLQLFLLCKLSIYLLLPDVELVVDSGCVVSQINLEPFNESIPHPGITFFTNTFLFCSEVNTSGSCTDRMRKFSEQFHQCIQVVTCQCQNSYGKALACFIGMYFYRHLDSDFLHNTFALFFVQVWLKTEVLGTPRSTDQGLNPWPPDHEQYISCPWDAAALTPQP